MHKLQWLRKITLEAGNQGDRLDYYYHTKFGKFGILSARVLYCYYYTSIFQNFYLVTLAEILTKALLLLTSSREEIFCPVKRQNCPMQ